MGELIILYSGLRTIILRHVFLGVTLSGPYIIGKHTVQLKYAVSKIPNQSMSSFSFLHIRSGLAMIAHMCHSRFVLWQHYHQNDSSVSTIEVLVYKHDLDVLVVVNASITCIKIYQVIIRYSAESLVSILMQIYMLNRIMYNRTQNHQYSYMCR